MARDPNFRNGHSAEMVGPMTRLFALFLLFFASPLLGQPAYIAQGEFPCWAGLGLRDVTQAKGYKLDARATLLDNESEPAGVLEMWVLPGGDYMQLGLMAQPAQMTCLLARGRDYQPQRGNCRSAHK